MTVLALILTAVPALSAQTADSAPIAVPSGAVVTWLDTVTDAPGPAGLTYRYRFVMPDLASRVPATQGPAGEDLTPEDMAELDDLGTGDAGGMDMAPAAGADAEGMDQSELVSPEDLDLPDFRPEDFADPTAEARNDAAAAGTLEATAPLPADPDILLQDPVHDDIVWLCNHWVLPRLAAAEPLPGQVVISLADRPTVFGEADMNAVQLFEAFSVSPDRKSCIWEAW